jgi:hypothetical protein
VEKPRNKTRKHYGTEHKERKRELERRTLRLLISSKVFVVSLAYQGKDILLCLRFIIEYIYSSSLTDFGPQVIIIIIGLFLYEDF